ncbi:MAG: thermonuclease family protein [Planctomycetaceae bacterium]
MTTFFIEQMRRLPVRVPPPGLPRRLRGAWAITAAMVAAAAAIIGPCATRPEKGRAIWRVETVHDGDTVSCLDPSGRLQKIRLVGIDAPELDQPHGRASRGALAAKIGGDVLVEERGRDRHGRLLGRLFVENRDVNLEMVTDGHAWAFTGFADDGILNAAENAARAARRGLWADLSAISPSRWRQEHPPYLDQRR